MTTLGMSRRARLSAMVMASIAFIGMTSSLGCNDRASSVGPLQRDAGKFVVDGISPIAGPITGGTRVTVQGIGFQEGATVTFGTKVAADIIVNDSTSITAITPASLEGSVVITVMNPDGRQRFFRDFKYIDPLKDCGCGWDVQRLPPHP